MSPSANQHPVFFTGRMPFLSPNRQCQNTDVGCCTVYKKYWDENRFCRQRDILRLCDGCQGAVSGCVISSVFSLWLTIGAFVVQPHRESLPTSVEHCNMSSSLLQNQTTRDPWTAFSGTNFPWNETGMEQSTVDGRLMSSTPDYYTGTSWTTAQLPTASYMQQL